MIAEFFTEATGEPTGNRKVERIHSVNSFQCLNRRFKKSVKKLPKTNRSRIVLSESDDSKQERILEFIFAGYVPLASKSPYPIIVYPVANYRPHHLSHFWANM